MREFDPELADIRFGYGLSPKVAPPVSTQAMLDGLTSPDQMADRFPIDTFDAFRERMAKATELQILRRKNRGTEIAATARSDRQKVMRHAREASVRWAGHTFLRQVWSETAFRERLVAFWANHFTAHGKLGVIQRGTSPFVEEAIRPHISGRFEDLLQAVIPHPMMLHYLDQDRSMGPNSPRGQGNVKGLNENLAREVLELHTIGVDGPYDQSDVRQLAELFTGMSFDPRKGFVFRPEFVEPGPEVVLGNTYSDAANISPIRAALSDLAAHPGTARTIARKLAVHFVSDAADPALIAELEAAYTKTDGALMPLYEILLNHPSSWDPLPQNMKPPIDFVASALRALAIPKELLMRFSERKLQRVIGTPLTHMGQRWQRPEGPDGWPEEDTHWITPQGLAGRVTWALEGPEFIMRVLPDPREFVKAALGHRADARVRFAASAAESRRDGIALVLMSPAFLRR